jgi:hypothetical protein
MKVKPCAPAVTKQPSCVSPAVLRAREGPGRAERRAGSHVVDSLSWPQVSDIKGDHLCSAAGVTESYLNDVLRRFTPQLEAAVNEQVAQGLLGALNDALAALHVRPYDAHPLLLAAQR